MIRLKNVSKIYYQNGVMATGFSKVNLELQMGEFVVIVGESGSGKSTLLNVISGLDTYEEGEMYINGEETSHYSESDFEEYRRKYVANIFQAFNLVESYTVKQNVELVLLIHGYKHKAANSSVNDIIKKVGLWDQRNKKVSKLSGGQKQRVAIARALAKDTPIIVADEPTGNLDKKSADQIFALLNALSKDKLVVVVTHNIEQVEKYASRIIKMNDGKVLEDRTITDFELTEAKPHESGSMKLSSKIRIGIRNTFNIFTKFSLLLAIFMFMGFALLYMYSNYKAANQDTIISGFNEYFNDSQTERIIIKKNDGGVISNEELEQIKLLDNVDYIDTRDLLQDDYIGFSYEPTGEEYSIYLRGRVYNVNTIDSVDYGRMPENANEFVIETTESYDYNDVKQYLDKTFEITSEKIQQGEKTTLVGIRYKDYNSYQEDKIYLTEEGLDIINKNQLESSNKVTVNLNGYKNIYTKDVIASLNTLNEGEILIPDYSYNYCVNDNCKNEPITITSQNAYNKVELNLLVKDVYTKNNYKNLVNINKYEENYIYISEIDYNKLKNNDGLYQISAFVKDEEKISETNEELRALGYTPLDIISTLQNSGESDFLKVLNALFRILSLVALFLVVNVVIYLILKSRKTFFAVVRMLGGTIKINKQLINIELITSASLSYLIVVMLIQYLIVNNTTIKIILCMKQYIGLPAYIGIYIIQIIISMLLAHKFSKKIFKDSMISTYNMEV